MKDNMKNILRKYYCYIPLKYRMGIYYIRIRRFLNKSQWWDRDKIENWQLQKLKHIVKYAYLNVSGYYSLYKNAGIKPEDILTLNDIKLLPFVTKELIRDNLNDFTSRTISKEKLIYVTTGGSTGIPLGFFQTKLDESMEVAFMHTGWQRIGWSFDDTSIVLRGKFIGSKEKFWKFDSCRKELLLSSYHLNEQTYSKYVKKILEYKPLYLKAYPSMATILSDLILNRNDVGKINFKAILLGSENIYPWQKEMLSTAFAEEKVFASYGPSQKVILAPMCAYSDQYHVWPFYGLTEIIKKTESDEVGELVGTSFWNYATPFIRYRTMDMGTNGKMVCHKCGRHFHLIKNIEGRLQDYLVTKDGAYIPVTALIFAQHFKAFGTIKNIQLYQKKIGEVIVKIVPTNKYSQEDDSEIKGKIEKAVDGRITVLIEHVNEISRTSRGKYKVVDQKINIKYGV